MPHRTRTTAPRAPAEPFDALLGAVKRGGFPFAVHPDRTLEIAPADLVRLTGAHVAAVARPASGG